MLKIFLLPVIFGVAATPTLDMHQIHKTLSSKDTTQESKDFLELVKNDQIAKVFDKNTASFSVSSINQTHKKQINLSAHDLTYKKSDSQSIINQLTSSFNAIDDDDIDFYTSHFYEKVKHFNESIIITDMQPKLQYVYFDQFDATIPDQKANHDLAAPEHICNHKVLNGNIGFVDKPHKVPKKYWTDSPDAEKSYLSSSIYGSSWSPWTSLDNNFSLINKIGQSYQTVSLRLKNDHSVKFDLTIPSGINRADTFVPESIKTDKDGNVEFLIGNNGAEYSNTIHKLDTIKKHYRAVFKVKGKFINQIKLDENFNLINTKWQTPQNQLNDIRYSYLNLSNKGQHQQIDDAKDFENNRAQIVSYLKQMRNSEYYDTAIKQYFLKSGDKTAKQFTTNEYIVNNRYDIKQYEFKVPDYFYGEYRSYYVNQNDLQHFYKYSGISNLISDMILLEKSSGVKTKFKSNFSVYDESDYEQIGLQFGFNNEFMESLALINNYNKLINEVLRTSNHNEEKYKNLLEGLWNFTINLQDYNGNLNSLMSKSNQLELTTINSALENLKNLLGYSGVLNAKQLSFYHDLPRIVGEHLKQLQITVSVSQANQLTETKTIFDNLEFEKINFNHETLNKNKFNLSNNLATMSLSNMKLTNKLYSFESFKNIDLTRLSRDYDVGDSMMINPNFIKYEISYCQKYQNFKPEYSSFKINRDSDKFGYSASHYVEANALNKSMEQAIINTIQNNFKGKTDTLAIDNQNLQIISNKTLDDNDFLFKNEINLIKNKFNLNFVPDNYLGEFYTLVLIKNSNHLNTIGSAQNPEIIKDNMWFVAQEKNNPLNRYYLVKLTAAKKKIDVDQIAFIADSPNNRIKMFIKNKHDLESDLIFLNIATNTQGEWIENQEINFSSASYYEINEIDNNSLHHLQIEFENALAELDLITTKPITFNFYLNQIIFNVASAKDTKIDISIEPHLNEKSIHLSYKINNTKMRKYSLSYELTDSFNDLKLDLSFDVKLSPKMHMSYIEPFKHQIIQNVKELINQDELVKSRNIQVEQLDINFLTMDNSISWSSISDKTKNHNYLLPILASIGSIIIISIIIAAAISIHIKKKK